MIKTLFASVCVLACCMGNEYPAKANPGLYRSMQQNIQRNEQVQRDFRQQQQQYETERRFRDMDRRSRYGINSF